jgi:hypothetical protein
VDLVPPAASTHVILVPHVFPLTSWIVERQVLTQMVFEQAYLYISRLAKTDTAQDITI